MTKTCFVALAVLLCTAPVASSQAQNMPMSSRVSPASLPLPLPGMAPMPPDRLRADNPWNLPMTGTWRFKLTHGQIVTQTGILDGQFALPPSAAEGLMASSYQTDTPPQNAFDGSLGTRWCANNGSFPQSLQADLSKTQHVTGITLDWERPTEHYRCRVEGSTNGQQWNTLADETASPGVTNGPVAITPGDFRYVRVVVTGSEGGWASLTECQIHVTENGRDTVWHPSVNAAALTGADDFTQPGYHDAAWDKIAVPSNWEMLGYSLPTYNSVDDTVGLYRRTVFVPKAWAGRRVYWRFDGALDGAEVFVNGQKAGYHESGYTAFDVDLTGLVRPGRHNLFAVRVSKTTPSVDCETGDFQCMGGIYRDTSLIAVPQTYINDITVRTPLSDDYKDATLQADVQVSGTPGQSVSLVGALAGTNGTKVPVRLSGQAKIGADGTVLVPLSVFVKAPRLWSAEKPDLYYLTLQLSHGTALGERVEQRFGFRQVEIKNDVVLWNGRPIKCTGVCRHDFWPTKGFALTDAEWNKDLTLMKAANINAIRTSHYNHAARFLELCEERGMYVLDEVPFCWINEKNNDPNFAPALLLRASDTLGRDKNRPCVLSWSLGNENGVGKNSQTVIDFVKKTDPTRPAFISQGGYWGPKGQSFQDMHYPTPADVDNYVAKDSAKLPAQFSEQPHIFYQKEQQEYDPGVSDLWSAALSRTWDKIWPAPTILGSFIWEWQNQGIADKNADHTTDFYYGLDHMRDENDKGVMDAYRNPKPEWWIVKMVYSPVVLGSRTVSPAGGACTVPVTNHYSFTDLKELVCRWTALRGETVLSSGVTHVACAPMRSSVARFPAPAGMTALRLVFDHADSTNVTVARLAVVGAPTPSPPAALPDGGALAVQDGTDTLRVSDPLQEIVFDKATGMIRYWRVYGRDVLTGSPALNLGQSMTDKAKGYYRAPQPPTLSSAAVTSQAQTDGSVRVTVAGTVLSDVGGRTLGTMICTYDIHPNAEIAVGWTLNWTAAETDLWEAGLALSVPAVDTRMGWWRDSFFTEYPAGHLGEPMGSCSAGDTLFRASKRGLHWMTLTDQSGTGLALLQQADTPLVARAADGPQGVTLLASEDVATSHDFSGTWVTDHDIHAVPGKPLSGQFTLCAIGP